MVPLQRRIRFLTAALSFTLAFGGCASAGAPASTGPTTTTSSSASPSSAPVSQSTGTSVPTPEPTLASTTEDASEAPAGAVPIKMIILPNAAPRFEPDDVSVKAGTVVFFLENIPNPPFISDHNMLIGPAMPEALARTPTIQRNRKVTFTVNDLPPGTYAFWCSIKDIANQLDHAGEGMVGTLTVTP